VTAPQGRRPAAEPPAPGTGRERSLILETGVGAVFHTALLFSLFLLFAGHNAPGGGFVGGLVAGAAFVLLFVEGGPEKVERAAPAPAPAMLGIGLTVAVATGAVAWLAGGEFLESAKADWHLPVLGTVHASSALAFDIGVYLVVVGLVVAVLTTLGAEQPDRVAGEEAP
jgi:multicomponent Na+:H+ antiporter subunit A